MLLNIEKINKRLFTGSVFNIKTVRSTAKSVSFDTTLDLASTGVGLQGVEELSRWHF